MVYAILFYYVTYLSAYPDSAYSLYLYLVNADNCPIFAKSFSKALTKKQFR